LTAPKKGAKRRGAGHTFTMRCQLCGPFISASLSAEKRKKPRQQTNKLKDKQPKGKA